MKLVDDIDNLVPRLNRLAQDTERIAHARPLCLKYARHIASRLEDIRILLLEVANQKERLQGNVANVLTIRKLAERYHVLEGVMKEIRNDLLRTERRN